MLIIEILLELLHCKAAIVDSQLGNSDLQVQLERTVDTLL